MPNSNTTLTIGEKKNGSEVTARKPICTDQGVMKALMQLEYKIQVSQYIRSLMAAPYNVRSILVPNLA